MNSVIKFTTTYKIFDASDFLFIRAMKKKLKIWFEKFVHAVWDTKNIDFVIHTDAKCKYVLWYNGVLLLS